MRSFYSARLSKILGRLAKSGTPSALLVGSAAELTKSRDASFPFRQSSDFYYLTGCSAKGCCLLLSTESRKPILFASKQTATQITWDGSAPSYTKLANELKAELVVSDDFRQEILKRLQRIKVLYYQNEPGSSGWNIAQHLIQTPSHRRTNMPSTFIHLDQMLAPMRLYKDKFELNLTKVACEITVASGIAVLPFIRPGVSEAEIATNLEYLFRKVGGDIAFPSIVASGRSAATLHYHDLNRSMKSDELVLMDFGASYNMYCADITRTIPVSGRFEGVSSQLYKVVLDAQKAALKTIRHGVSVKEVYNAAARVLTKGLVKFGVLRGNAATHFKRGTFRKYFPHGIGHSIGLDVHDIGELRATNDARLEAGMLFTVEPGLYFAKGVGKLPACGVRIEDTVLVTKRGCEVLTSGFPKEIDEIESLMNDLLSTSRIQGRSR